MNIYCDVAPFKETAVVLKGGTPDNVDSSTYINACFIKSSFREPGNPNGLIIATQGPQLNTIENFWKLVLENNVTKIVTLCQNIGNGYHDDAVQYFPPSNSSQFNSISVSNETKTKVTQHVDIRNLLVSDGQNSIKV